MLLRAIAATKYFSLGIIALGILNGERTKQASQAEKTSINTTIFAILPLMT